MLVGRATGALHNAGPTWDERSGQGGSGRTRDSAEAVGCYSANEDLPHIWIVSRFKHTKVCTLFQYSKPPPSPATPWPPGAARNHSAATRLSLGAYTWMVQGWLQRGSRTAVRGERGESRVDSVGMSFMLGLGTHLPVVELALALILALTLTLTLARCRQPGVQRQSVERDAASAKTSRRGRGSGGRMVVVERDGVSRRRGEHLGDIGRYGEM